MHVNCLKCKGRLFCGRDFCPLKAKQRNFMPIAKKVNKIKEDVSSIATAPFIGHSNYPNVKMSLLAPIEKDDEYYDSPQVWSEKNYGIEKLAGIRYSLLNSVSKQENFVDNLKLSAMSRKPVDTELKLKSKPVLRMENDDVNAPHGPSAEVKRMELTSNPKIPRKVDYLATDPYVKANQAVVDLYKKFKDENYASKILSVGTLGMKKDEKIVPTRWSITATDDIVSKEIIQKIKNYRQADYMSFFGGYLGNYFLVMIMPDAFSYELFETYMPNVSWNQSSQVQYTTDYEFYNGRKEYAHNCAGGYYAARLGVVEKMEEMKIQGSVIVIRVITGEYAMPLGVWVVREAVRKAMKSAPIRFSDREYLLKYGKALVKKKFGYDTEHILKASKILENKQKKLTSFIRGYQVPQ